MVDTLETEHSTIPVKAVFDFAKANAIILSLSISLLTEHVPIQLLIENLELDVFKYDVIEKLCDAVKRGHHKGMLRC